MIDGNTYLQIKVKTGNYTINSIGERVIEIIDYIKLWGYLDLSNADTKQTIYNAKIQESDHIFLCEYTKLPLINEKKPKTSELIAENDGNEYDVILIDNPMNLNQHYEIYLRYKGE